VFIQETKVISVCFLKVPPLQVTLQLNEEFRGEPIEPVYSVQTGSGAHPASYLTVPWALSDGKAAKTRN
jgi:hypothetical protein